MTCRCPEDDWVGGIGGIGGIGGSVDRWIGGSVDRWIGGSASVTDTIDGSMQG
jgi:hypothetical protein